MGNLRPNIVRLSDYDKNAFAILISKAYHH